MTGECVFAITKMEEQLRTFRLRCAALIMTGALCNVGQYGSFARLAAKVFSRQLQIPPLRRDDKHFGKLRLCGGFSITSGFEGVRLVFG